MCRAGSPHVGHVERSELAPCRRPGVGSSGGGEATLQRGESSARHQVIGCNHCCALRGAGLVKTSRCRSGSRSKLRCTAGISMHIAATQSVTLHIILAIPHTSLRAGTEFSLNSNHLPMAALKSEKKLTAIRWRGIRCTCNHIEGSTSCGFARTHYMPYSFTSCGSVVSRGPSLLASSWGIKGYSKPSGQ